MTRQIVPVILCGGAGSRLWPMSRQLLPKQFLPLVTGRTLLQDTALRARVAQDTALRAKDLPGDTRMIVICNEAHRFLVQDQLAEIGVAGRIVLEPAGRGTAAAVAVAALACEKEDPVLLVLASDHAIRGTEAFNAAVARAAEVAGGGMLATFGIAATRPDSGFGYIERGEALKENAFKVKRFVEKPAEKDAAAMIATGRVYWNSGMFAFGAKRVLDELARHRPDILAAAR
ncbi:MAG TPA: sugar phosphate nucleotidyltransferase, partial [Burkholderiales bacterium]